MFPSLKNFMDKQKDKGITATMIAKELGISKKTLSNYINGDAYMPLKHLNALSNIYNVSIDYLLGLSEIPQYNNSCKYEILDKKLVGERLKTFRKENKLSQDNIASLTNLHKSNICRYESGENLILTISLYSICKKYKVSADFLLGKID